MGPGDMVLLYIVARMQYSTNQSMRYASRHPGRGGPHHRPWQGAHWQLKICSAIIHWPRLVLPAQGQQA
jgi:hypothetical protein